jgi:lysophospholipid acyltransferase (LPLAT)-like uncharacterized protein
MKSILERGESVAFTIDGPRGPKYLAKPGPVGLSKVTSIPMAAFYVALGSSCAENVGRLSRNRFQKRWSG